jgi:hypothetical protein
MVYENSSELLRGDRKEMSPILPIHWLGCAQPHVEFVHQRARLQRVITPLLPHLTASHAAEFFVCCFHNAIASLFISGTPSKQERR